MPTATPNSIRKCTEVIGRFHAGSLDVCREGAIVALHMATPAGVLVVTLDEREFVTKARGRADYHGHPFRNLSDLNPPANPKAQMLGDAPEKPRLPRGEATARCPLAWEALKRDLARSIEEVSEEQGIPKSTLHNWLGENHPGEFLRLRRAAGLTRFGRPRKTTPADVCARDEKCAAAWAWMQDPANAWQSTNDVAPRFGVTPMRLSFWCARHHRAEYYQLRAARRKSQIPGAKSQKPAALTRSPGSPGHSSDERRPVLKPGGKIL